MLELGPLPTQETVGGLLRADLPEADARHLIASPWAPSGALGVWILYTMAMRFTGRGKI